MQHSLPIKKCCMNKFTVLIFATIFLLTTAGAQDGFVLTGRITGYKDSTRIIINKVLSYGGADFVNEKTLYLFNGEFSFSDNVKGPTQYSIRIRPKDVSDENFIAYENLHFWAEAKPMTLTATKGNIAFANISGSELQDQYEAYINLEKEMKMENKRITDSVKMNPGMDERTITSMRTRFKRNNETIENASIAFVYDHPDYHFSLSELAFRIKYYPTTLAKDKVVSFYKQLSNEQRENEYGQLVSAYIQNTALLKSPAVKDRPHPFELQDASGSSVSLASFKGRWYFLIFGLPAADPAGRSIKPI